MAKKINKTFDIPTVRVRNLKVYFGTNKHKHKVVTNLDLDGYQNQSLAIVGESGSGKTTIAKAIIGLNPIYAGQVYFDNNLIYGKPFNFITVYKGIKNNIASIQKTITRATNKLNKISDILQSEYHGYSVSKQVKSSQLCIVNTNVEPNNDNTGDLFASQEKLIASTIKENDDPTTNSEVFGTVKVNYTKFFNRINNHLQELSNYAISLLFKNRKIETLNNSINTFIDDLKYYVNIEYLNIQHDLQPLISKISQLLQKYINFNLNNICINFCKSITELTKTINSYQKFNHNAYVVINDKLNQVYDLLTNIIGILENIKKIPIDKNDFRDATKTIKYHYRCFLNPTHKRVHDTKQKLQMIFQDPTSSLNDCMTVESIIAEGLYNFKDIIKNAKPEYVAEMNKKLSNDEKISENDHIALSKIAHYLVAKILNKIGLSEEHMLRYSHEFSGGQKQRIGIARAMIIKPKYLLADEPISALDVSIRAQVLNLLSEFQKEYKLGYIFIAHDLSIVQAVADHVIVLYKGKIVEQASCAELYKNPIHPYTKSLFSAIPLPSPDDKTKELYVYKPTEIHYDYIFYPPSMHVVNSEHKVYCNDREFNEWTGKKIMKKNKPITKNKKSKK